MWLSAAAIALAAVLPVAPAAESTATSELAVERLCSPALVAVDARTGTTVIDRELLPALGPTQILRGIAELDLAQLGAVSADREFVESFLLDQPSAGQTETWWTALDDSTRRDLLAGAPSIVGNLDGVPYDVRDAANRDLLESEIDEIRAALSAGMGKGAGTQAVNRLRMLEQIESALQETPGGPDRRLILLDTAMPGRAAVAIGDLDTADSVGLLVPGALLSVREHMREWTKATEDIYDAQLDWKQRFGDPGTVATISWIGYQTPDVTNVMGLDLAEQGATFLSGTVNGLKALRSGDEPYISVFAHSYGATAAMLALERGDMSIDALAMMGAPGGSATTASDLAVPDGNVWVGQAAWDPVVHLAFFGIDPGSPAFGAKTMSVAGIPDPVTGASLIASIGHDWYLEPGTESLRNLALIGIDRGEFVTSGEDDDAKTLALLSPPGD